MANDRFPFEELPTAILENEVGSNLATEALANASLLSKKYYGIFQKPLTALKLLHFVEEANYEEASKIVKENPQLMFQHVLSKKADGTYEKISPLKFAFKVYDTYMWKMFLDIIKDMPHGLNHFMQQAHEQTEHIDLEPLFAEYESFQKKYIDYITSGNNNDAWHALGRKQREVLPRHMLKEFCRLRPDANFDVRVDPPPTSDVVYYCNEGKNISILPFVANTGLGFEFTLITFPKTFKPSACKEVWRWPHYFSKDHVADDLAMFRRLEKTRINDLAKLLSPTSEIEDRKKMEL